MIITHRTELGDGKLKRKIKQRKKKILLQNEFLFRTHKDLHILGWNESLLNVRVSGTSP